ncbi:hypothetical protein G9F32_05600 [Acinetobacter sp. 194]|nr:hypothetical protein [Acinetobacter shaoyimingii]
MLDNNITLLNEITRVGETEKWNSSLFFEGPLKIRVLKDGTVTDVGSFILSKKKFGYPAIIKVLNLDDREKKFIFIFSPPSQPLFKNSLFIDLKKLNENNYLYSGAEVVNKDSSLYMTPYSPVVLYKHVFKNTINKDITYNFYSPSKDLVGNLKYVRLVVYFNDK